MITFTIGELAEIERRGYLVEPDGRLLYLRDAPSEESSTRGRTMETLTAAQLADAYIAVARADHYMVGIVATVTISDRDAAEQILISRQNAENRGNENYRRLDFAIDLLEQDRRMAGDAP